MPVKSLVRQDGGEHALHLVDLLANHVRSAYAHVQAQAPWTAWENVEHTDQ